MRHCLGCSVPLDPRDPLTHIWCWCISHDDQHAVRRTETAITLCAACGEEYETLTRRYLGLDVAEKPLRTEHAVPLELRPAVRSGEG